MKVDIKLGTDGREVEIIDKETGQRIVGITELKLTIVPNDMPRLRLDIEADNITVEGKNIDTEIGKITMLHVEGWAEKNGFKLVVDDGLDVELGRE